MADHKSFLTGKGSALWGRGGTSDGLGGVKRMRLVVAVLALAVGLTAPSAAFAKPGVPQPRGVDFLANWTS